MNEEEPVISSQKLARDERGRLLPGQDSLNPLGRPVGRYSLTSQIIKRLENNPNIADEIIEWLIANRKDLVWNKIDPNPPQDFNVGGQKDNPIRIIEVEIDEDKTVSTTGQGL